MKWSNNITEKLNIKFPIIQAPMFGVVSPEMVAATCKAGCLGSLPLGNLSAEDCLERIDKTRKLTSQNFAVNIFVNEIPKVTIDLNDKYVRTKSFIETLASKNGLEVRLPNINEIEINDYKDQVDLIISENCKVLSFTFGMLDANSIYKLKKNNITLIGTCTSLEEALELEKLEIDIICFQGIEAGGHQGGFQPIKKDKPSGFSLLKTISSRIKKPIIYAGGLNNAESLVTAHKLGAEGFQFGSLLLRSKESNLRNFEKEKLKNIDKDETTLTNSFSGRYARGIRNLFTETIDSKHTLPYPYQNKLTSELRKLAKRENQLDFVSIWVGKSHYEFSENSTTDILDKLIENVEKLTLKHTIHQKIS